MTGPEMICDSPSRQTTEIIERWRRFKAEHNQSDREALIVHYLPLVRRVAGVVKQTLPRAIDLDDLVGWGTLGLIDAVEKYEPDRGIAFSSFAQFRIRGAIRDELRRLDWLPRSVRAAQKRQKQEPSEVSGSPTGGEDNFKFSAAGTTPKMMMLDDAFMTDERRGLLAPAGQNRVEMLDACDHLLRGLSRSERLVMILYHCEEMSMQDVAVTLGISECRVSQIRSRVITWLRSIERKAA